MLSITRNIVNDRYSNRLDNVMGILGSDLAKLVGDCLHRLRCLTHQQCFASERGTNPRGWGRGFKRDAYEPATPATLRLVTLTASHRAVSYAG